MDTGFLRVLFDPGRFFEERMRGEAGLKIPALIILAYGIVGAVAAALMVNVIIAILPGEAQAYAAFGIAIAVIGALIMGYLMWIACAVILYAISMIFKGRTFTRTLEFTGYGFCPSSSGVSSGCLLLPDHIEPDNPPMTNIEQIAEVSESLAGIIATDP